MKVIGTSLVLAVLVLRAVTAQADVDQSAPVETHADALADLQSRLDAYERRGNGLTEQVASIIGKRKQGAEEALESYADHLAAAKKDLSELGDAETSPSWDALRKKAEDDLEALRNAVDALERAAAQR